MPFWKRRESHWDEQTDEYYAERIRERTATDRIRILPHILTILFLAALFLGAVGVVGGKTMFEKTLTSLASPCGILWLVMILLIYFCLLFRQAWPALLGIICFLLLSISGNSFIANWLAQTREAPYLNIDPMKMEPYDVVFVLGGGTSTKPDGRSQLTSTGDRIATAARLFHAGKIKHIICTGNQSFRSTEKDLHPHEEAAIILQELKVPPSAIEKMTGLNTSEEIQNIAKWQEANPNPGRVGILTSTWHLKRAMRLSETEGVIADPIPADALSGPFRPNPSLLIPSARNLMVTQIMLKEYLADFVAR